MFKASFFEFSRDAGAGCRLRFAPTPSGFLHIGNALNFTLNWLVARLNNGKILLRIDDLDADRKRPEYIQDVFESLHWLGLDWDEGPGIQPEEDPVHDFEHKWSQHTRMSIYFDVLSKLRAKNLLFACRKSRNELAPFDGKYPEVFRNQYMSLDDQDVAWRIFSEETSGLGDFVARRRDGIPAYQIASFADDIFFRITHVVRGEDLTPSTSAQRYIARCLQDDRFLKIKFLHHPLLLDSAGEKLSKSAGATSLKAIREGGGAPGEVFAKASAMLGLKAVGTAADLLAEARIAMALS